jgi:pimeloyl-ACP methyl ester carboxylesterase
MLLVHGLGSSHAAWLAAGRLMSSFARVVAVDLAGFGYSPLGRRSASVRANRKLAGHVVDAMFGSPAILVGNSMGGVVAMLEAAARPDHVSGVVLVNPGLRRPSGVHLDRPLTRMFGTILIPLAGERYLDRRWRSLGPDGLVHSSLELCCVDPGRVPDEVVDAMVAVSRSLRGMPGARLAYIEAARSLVPYMSSSRRFDGLVSSFVQPTLLIHGEQDRLVPVSAAHAVARRRPSWCFEQVAGIGHTPQMEAPDQFAGIVARWLDSDGRAAAEAATSH